MFTITSSGTGFDEEAALLGAGREFALMKTASGKVGVCTIFIYLFFYSKSQGVTKKKAFCVRLSVCVCVIYSDACYVIMMCR